MSSEVVSSEVAKFVRTDGFESLVLWQKAMDLVTEIYRFSEHFPKTEVYGLTSQLRRAASSIPANVAEGYGRSSIKEEQRFLSIAYGSLMEVETFLILAQRLGYLNDHQFVQLNTLRGDVGSLLIGYRRSKQE
ncbi:four helix bundle protein [Candidatus Berkelbacteria bacterium]|nr:four helix bundle protein [Candidatus Berkelbacteria bacterium]